VAVSPADADDGGASWRSYRLCWSDINVEKGEIYIGRTIVRVNCDSVSCAYCLMSSDHLLPQTHTVYPYNRSANVYFPFFYVNIEPA